MKKDRGKLISKALPIFIWIMIYQAVSLYIGKSLLVPTVGEILGTFINLCGDSQFWSTVFFSVLRVFCGFAAGIVIGTLLAAASYFSKAVYSFFYPVLSVIRAAPVASFIILALLWIKSGHVPAFISFLMVIPVVWQNIVQGLMETDKSLLEMAEIFEFSIWKKIKMIYIPQAMPYFKTACITSLGFAWKSGIAAEVISTPKLSIGRRLYESKLYIETPELFAWTLTVILLSIIAEKAFKLLLGKLFKSR